MRDGCKKADKFLGGRSRCVECPFNHCHLDDREWAPEGVRWPGRILCLWYEKHSIRKVAVETGVSESTVKRSLRALRPPTWGPEWRAWRNRMVFERHAEGRSISELTWLFKLSHRQVYRILKEGSHNPAQHQNGLVAPRRKRQTIMKSLEKKLSDTHGYKLWQIYRQQMRWLMEGDLSVIRQTDVPSHLSPSTQ